MMGAMRPAGSDVTTAVGFAAAISFVASFWDFAFFGGSGATLEGMAAAIRVAGSNNLYRDGEPVPLSVPRSITETPLIGIYVGYIWRAGRATRRYSVRSNCAQQAARVSLLSRRRA